MASPTVTPPAAWQLWEKKVVKLLKDLGFEDVDGDRNNGFKLGGQQIDACGGVPAAGTLLVIECKTKDALAKKTVRGAIKDCRAMWTPIQKAAKKHKDYQKYTRMDMMILAENYQFTDADKEFAEKSDNQGNYQGKKIILKSDDFYDYYRELYRKIDKFAIFDMLGELEIRRQWGESISTIALKTSFNTKEGKSELFQFMLDPKKLLEIATVARREKRGDEYYQREVKLWKINQIKDFLNKGKILPNSIILAFDQAVMKYVNFSPIDDFEVTKVMDREYDSYSPDPSNRFANAATPGKLKKIGEKWGKLSRTEQKKVEADEAKRIAEMPSFGRLDFPLQFRTCWIIDGQHRLYAFAKGVEKDLNVPIIAFNRISWNRQAKMFLDINKNQTKVDSDLVWDLNGELYPEEEDGLISNIVKDLNVLGPLKDKIYLPSNGPKAGQPGRKSITSLCKQIQKLQLVRTTTRSKLLNPLHVPEKTLQNGTKTGGILATRVSVVKHFKIFYEECKKIFKDDWDMGNNGWILDDSSGDTFIQLFEKIVAHSVKKKIQNQAGAQNQCTNCNATGKVAGNTCKQCSGIGFIKANVTLNAAFYEKYLLPLTGWIALLDSDGDKMHEKKAASTTEDNKTDRLKEFCDIISVTTNEKDFCGVVKSQLEKKTQQLVAKMKQMITSSPMRDPNDPQWLRKFVTTDEYNKLGGIAKKNGRETDLDSYYKGLTFGQTIKVIKQDLDRQVEKCIVCNGKKKFAGKDCSKCGGEGIKKESILFPYFSEKSMSGYSGVSDKEKVKLIKVGLNVISKWRNMEEYGEGSEQQKKGDKKMFEVNFEKITDCVDDGIKLFGETPINLEAEEEEAEKEEVEIEMKEQEEKREDEERENRELSKTDS